MSLSNSGLDSRQMIYESERAFQSCEMCPYFLCIYNKFILEGNKKEVTRYEI